MGLEEGNQYLEFLRKEFGVAYTLATGVMELTQADATAKGALLVARTFTDGAITAYEEYRFLNIDREAARVLVESTQNKYAEYFSAQVDKASSDPNSSVGGYTLSDALNAVSVIEYQCTREGIRALLNRSVNNSPTNLQIDEATGTIFFNSTKIGTAQGTGLIAPAVVVPVAPKFVPAAPVAIPAPVTPAVVVPQKSGGNQSSGGAAGGGGSKPVGPSGDGLTISGSLLNALLTTGTADARAKARMNLQDLLMTDPEVMALLPSPSVQIEVVVRRPGATFDKIRDLLVVKARMKGWIT